jgi:hypothetical protein
MSNLRLRGTVGEWMEGKCTCELMEALASDNETPAAATQTMILKELKRGDARQRRVIFIRRDDF